MLKFRLVRFDSLRRAKGVVLKNSAHELRAPYVRTVEQADEVTSVDHPPDPTEKYLEEKARRRAKAAKAKEPQTAADLRGWFRADTTSGSFRPLKYGRGK